MYQYFTFYDQIIFYCVDKPHSVYPFTRWWVLGLYIVNNAALNISAQIFVWTFVFISLESIPKNWNCWPNDNTLFNILRNSKNDVQSDCAIYISTGVYESSDFSTYYKYFLLHTPYSTNISYYLCRWMVSNKFLKFSAIISLITFSSPFSSSFFLGLLLSIC